MLKVGKIYKLKKIKDLENMGGRNLDTEYKILKFEGDTVYCQNQETKELNMFNKQDFIDPEFPDDIYSNLNIVWEKLEAVMKPMSVHFWKNLKEEATFSSLGAAPCPAMGAITSGRTAAATVNGIPVPSQSAFNGKKKKKSKKKNESIGQIIKLSPEEMIDMVDETFNPNDKLVTTIKNGRELIEVSVYYTNPEDQMLTHTLHLKFCDPITEDVIDETIEEDLTLNEVKDDLIHLFSTREIIDGELYENIIEELLNENFFEDYENITDVIAKHLDRLNFHYANTEDIIYKKEGDLKYLIKFDNGLGLLKVKVSKGQEIIFEKEYQLETEDDVNNAFAEIEDVYRSNGL